MPAVGYALLILAVSSVPGSDLPPTGVPTGDKLLHIVEYAILGGLLMLPVRDLEWRGRALILAVGTVYAAFDEAYQTTVPGRFGDWRDFAMDLVGILVAVAVHIWRYLAPITAKT